MGTPKLEPSCEWRRLQNAQPMKVLVQYFSCMFSSHQGYCTLHVLLVKNTHKQFGDCEHSFYASLACIFCFCASFPTSANMNMLNNAVAHQQQSSRKAEVLPNVFQLGVQRHPIRQTANTNIEPIQTHLLTSDSDFALTSSFHKRRGYIIKLHVLRLLVTALLTAMGLMNVALVSHHFPTIISPYAILCLDVSSLRGCYFPRITTYGTHAHCAMSLDIDCFCSQARAQK